MPVHCLQSWSRRLAAAALVAAGLLLLPNGAEAQVVALVNGAPITDRDIGQRIKLIELMTHKPIDRKAALQGLVDDQLKIFIARRYSVDVTEQDVDNAFGKMAERAHLSPQQLEQTLITRGLSPSAMKFKIRADMVWGQLVRGRYSSTLEVSDADINNALKGRSDDGKNEVGYIYTMYPVTLIASRGSEGDMAARRREAENLRARFQSCDEGLKLARALRDVVVRPSVIRNSAELAPQLRDVLNKMEIGKLTAPEATDQGIQMFALCDRKESKADSPARRTAREEIFTKRFEAESKKFLDEVRRQAMIEYR